MAIRVGDTKLLASDLDDMPDDGRRRELIDGVLYVTPAPSGPHQTAVGNLHLALRAARPEVAAVLFAPFDFRPDERTNLDPDLLVVDAVVSAAARAVDPPRLVVEVLSPRTRTRDLGVKRSAYERLGVAVYWVVDTRAGTLTVFSRAAAGGAFDDGTIHGPGGRAVLHEPFPVTLDLDNLLVP